MENYPQVSHSQMGPTSNRAATSSNSIGRLFCASLEPLFCLWVPRRLFSTAKEEPLQLVGGFAPPPARAKGKESCDKREPPD